MLSDGYKYLSVNRLEKFTKTQNSIMLSEKRKQLNLIIINKKNVGNIKLFVMRNS